MPASLYSARLLSVFAGGEHEEFLAAGGRPLRVRVARAMALAELRPDLVVVDLGSGRGEATLHAARRGARVVAVDYADGGTAMTRRTLALGLAGRPPRHPPAVLRADATRVPIAAGAADRVLLLDVVEHLHPWQLARALDETRRILRPGGHVVIHTLPNRRALAVAWPLLRLIAGRRLPAVARSDYERAVHVNEQDPGRLRRALRRAGLECRVWVEEWTTRQAARSVGRAYPDELRRRAYPLLAGPAVRRSAALAMATPIGPWLGNDIFAVAWLAGFPPASRPAAAPVR